MWLGPPLGHHKFPIYTLLLAHHNVNHGICILSLLQTVAHFGYNTPLHPSIHSLCPCSHYQTLMEKLHPFLLLFKRHFYLHQALECTKVKQLGKSRSLLDLCILKTLKTLPTFNIPSKNRATSPS